METAANRRHVAEGPSLPPRVLNAVAARGVGTTPEGASGPWCGELACDEARHWIPTPMSPARHTIHMTTYSVPPRILFLHGYGLNAEVARAHMIHGLYDAFGQDAEIQCLDGFQRLETLEHFEVLLGHQVMDKYAKLARDDLDKARRLNLRAWALREIPPKDELDCTTVWNSRDIPSALASRSCMAEATARLRQHIIDNNGYDLLAGFSQGGELVVQIARELGGLNEELSRASGRSIKGFLLFSCRFGGRKYGFGDHKIDGSLSDLAPEFTIPAFYTVGLQDEQFRDNGRNSGAADHLRYMWLMRETMCLNATYAHHSGAHHMPAAGDPVHELMAKHVYPRVGCASRCWPLLLDVTLRCTSRSYSSP